MPQIRTGIGSCERGNALIVVAALMPLLVGAGAVGIDVAQWTLAKRQLQRAADTGAIAGATAVMKKDAPRAAVERTLLLNNQVAFSAEAVVENAPTVGALAGDTGAVRVVLSTTPSLAFVSFFYSGPTTISAESTAKAVADNKYCFVTLEDGPFPGYDFSGSSGVNAECGLMTNSRAKPSAVVFGGASATLKASSVAAVGALTQASNYVSGTNLVPYQSKLPDPYAYAPEASNYGTSCSGTSLVVDGASWNNKTLSQGCWSSLSFKTKVTLNAGTYVVKGGSLDFGAGADVSANGPVTFILTGDSSSSIAKLSIGSTATIKLNAPTTGPLQDILFYQDRRARYLSNENSMSGNSTSSYGGGFYFPGSNLYYIGASASAAVCVRIVSLRASFGGNSGALLSCGSNKDKLFGQSVRIVA